MNYPAFVKLKDKLENILYGCAMVGLGLATFLVFLGTLTRYFSGLSYEWVSELCRYSVIMAAFFLSGPLLYNKGNVALDVITGNVKNKKVKTVLDIIYYVSSMIVVIVMFVVSIMLFVNSKGQLTYSLVFPVRFPYILLPIGMFFSIIFITLKFILWNHDIKVAEEALKEETE